MKRHQTRLWFQPWLPLAVLACLLIFPPAVPGLTEREPNNKKEDAQELRLGESAQGYFQLKGDSDWYRLTVDSPERLIIRIDLTGVLGVDSMIDVFDSAGGKLTGSNVGGPGEAEAVINLGLARGVYFIRTGCSEMNTLNMYTLRTVVIGPWQSGLEIEPNDQAQQANDLAPGVMVRGYFYPSADSDWYKIKIDGPGRQILRIFLSGVPEVDTGLEIYDHTGLNRMLHHNGSGTGAPEAIINMGVTAGEYFVRVNCPSRSFNANFEYALIAEAAGPWLADQEFEPNNDKAQAQDLPPDREVQGYFYPDGDTDWYVLTVPEPGMDMLSIDLTGAAGVNARLELMDAEGGRLIGADHQSEGQGETITAMKISPGTYYLAVSGRGSNDDIRYHLRAGSPDIRPPAEGDADRALEKSLDFLAGRQKPEGGYPGPSGESTGTVGLGLMAFLGAEGAGKDYSDQAEASIAYLKTKYHPGTDYKPGSIEQARFGGLIAHRDDLYSHAIATLALTEALVRSGDAGLEPMIEDALGLITGLQNTEHKPPVPEGPGQAGTSHDGGWRDGPFGRDCDLLVSGWQVLALRAGMIAGFPVPDGALEKAAAFIRACYDREAGGFFVGAEEQNTRRAPTAAGVLSLQMCGYPDDPLISPSIRFMLDNPPVWPDRTPEPDRPFYYWYYGTRAMMKRGGEDWRVWKAWMGRFLIDHQNEDGSWVRSRQETRSDPSRTTALGALTLALCRGYTPVYMRRLGTLSVVTRGEAGRPIVTTRVPKTIELILDASNSMWRRVEGRWKIEIVREALESIIRALPGDIQVGLRAYGNRSAYRRQNCEDSELVVPVGPINRRLLIKKMKEILPRGMTPIAYALNEAGKDLSGIEGEKVIVLLSDGRESCEGDPAAVAETLSRAGLELTCHVVGFAIRREQTRGQLQAIAGATGGRYFEAAGAEELRAALAEAMEETVPLSYRLYDEAGREILAGPADSGPRRLKAGTYRIVLDADPPLEIRQVVIEADGETRIEVKMTPDGLAGEIK